MNTSQEFESFFRSYYTKAYHLAMSLVKDEVVSQDIVSDALEKVWLRCKERPLEHPQSFLFITVKNLCTDHFRHKSVHDNYTRLMMHQPEPTESDYMDHEQRLMAVMKQIEELPPRTQRVIKLHYVEQKKYREIAEEMGITLQGVKKHVMTALGALREKNKKNNDF